MKIKKPPRYNFVIFLTKSWKKTQPGWKNCFLPSSSLPCFSVYFLPRTPGSPTFSYKNCATFWPIISKPRSCRRQLSLRKVSILLHLQLLSRRLWWFLLEVLQTEGQVGQKKFQYKYDPEALLQRSPGNGELHMSGWVLVGLVCGKGSKKVPENFLIF